MTFSKAAGERAQQIQHMKLFFSQQQQQQQQQRVFDIKSKDWEGSFCRFCVMFSFLQKEHI